MSENKAMGSNTQLSRAANSRFDEVLEDQAVVALIKFREGFGISSENTKALLSDFYHGETSAPDVEPV